MAERGTIGKATFDRVQELVGAGASKSEAFAKVADESGRTAATVATAFYRVARSLPDGGGVKQRPRKKTASAAAPARRPREATPTIDAIVADLHRGVDALAARLRAAEGELAARRDESARIDQIRKMLGS